MAEVVLAVSGLTVRRNQTLILDQVDWEVTRGQHWVILGANGSGKTSLLSSLAGYLTPTRGVMTVLGKRFGRADWRALRLQIGLVSSSVRQMMPNDEPALLTVASGKYAMIDFWGELKTSDKREAKKILQQIECEHIALRTWQVLSQGERQRVLIGRALMARPALLILDEPCAGLDPVAREHFLAFLERLGRSRGGPTMVLVTHHVEEIMPVFTHVLLLKDGHVFAAGRKTKVLTARNLGEAFNTQMKLRTIKERYSLAIVPSRQVVI